MDSYITIEATNLPKRLPLSPDTVYRYINGSAQFWGFDFSTTYRLIQQLKYKGGLHYLWGKDTELNEPALGVSPLSITNGLRYESRSLPLFAEATIRYDAEQDRISTPRGEQATDNYTTVDLLTGFTLWKQVSLQLGVNNLFDVDYVNHLNAKNPFTGMQIPEPGRYFFADINIRF